MSLQAQLLRRIALTGPMTMAEYMQTCLTDPNYGYYTTRDPLGQAGDFTTAPEISQMFGEMLGLWLAQVWSDQGAPARFGLVELGPGRGTLMADILRATRNVAGFHAALTLFLMDASPVLRTAQAKRLADYNPVWIADLNDLPGDVSLFCVANEFFDALPVRQFLRTEAGWQERMIGMAEGALQFGLAPALSMPVLEARFADLQVGALVEYAPQSEAIAADLSTRIQVQGGVALFLDYGAWDGSGDTVQAMRDHAYADVLQDPGSADLTAHVGFRWLAEAATPLAASFAEQGRFLMDLGIGARAQQLASAQPDRAEKIETQLRRLTDGSQMGSLFKALGLRRMNTPALPGF